MPDSTIGNTRASSHWIPERSAEIAAVTVLLTAFTWLAIANALATSATYDEPVHLAAGYNYWQGDFRFNPEHPPLLKLLAALPTSGLEHGAGTTANQNLLSKYRQAATSNSNAQWPYAHALLYGLNDAALKRLNAGDVYRVPPATLLTKGDFARDADRLLLWGRIPGIVFAVLLGLLVFLWARGLFGSAAAMLALALYCFDPNFIANSGLVTTDVAAACFFFATLFGMWRLTRQINGPNLAVVVAGFALMCITKYSAVVLLPALLLPAAVFLLRSPKISVLIFKRWQPKGLPARFLALAGFCLLLAVCAWLAIWACYGFRYRAMTGPDAVAMRLEPLLRQSAGYKKLMADRPAEVAQAEVERAIAGAKLGPEERLLQWVAEAHLLPEAYIYGFTWVRANSQARFAFLRGRISVSGFRDYFFWTFILKTPLVTILAMLAAVILALMRRIRIKFFDGVCLLVPVGVYLFFTLLTRLNIGHRHLLPIYPFLFVLAGGLLQRYRPTDWRSLLGPLIGFGFLVLGSFFVFAPPWRPQPLYGNHLTYFNELAGGPRGGYRHLVDANLDWGQNLKRLQRWLDEQQIDEPVGLCYFGSADPRYYGIRHLNLPGGFPYEPRLERLPTERPPRYLVISATHLQGPYLGTAGRRSWRQFLRRYEQIAVVGHTFFIYRVHEDPAH